MIFGEHNVVCSELFLDYLYKIWQMLSVLYSDVQKNFYIDAHLFFQISSIYTKWGAQTFPLICGLFAIFDHNFVEIMEIVVPPSDKNKNSLAPLKGHFFRKKMVKTVKRDP